MTIRQDLKEFQQDLVAQLTQDIGRLQAEKVQLLSDIASLRQQKQSLETQTQASLTQQQSAQQQLWAKQLAQALATRLYVLLSEKIQADPGYRSQVSRSLQGAPTPQRHRLSAVAGQSLNSLDKAIQQTVSSLQQDLDSYQSAINQKLSRMQSLENQGEAILDALVSRLNRQLQALETPSSAYACPPSQTAATGTVTNGSMPISPKLPAIAPTAYTRGVQPGSPVPYGYAPPGYSNGGATQYASPTGSLPQGEARQVPPSVLPVGQAPESSPSPTPTEDSQDKAQNPIPSWIAAIPAFQKGLILILLSTVALSLHNVVVQVIGNESNIFNIWRLGGYISLTSLDSSLLILWLRMIVVLPLMATLATFLYPMTWADIKSFAISRDRRQLRNVIGSGFFLFLSQVFIYIAIGQVGAGVAVTILFMYPIFTVPLAWWLFGDRPTSLRILVMIGIFTGVVCTFLPKLLATNNFTMLGVGTAIFAGIAFACYLISMQLSFRKLHPIPVSVIQFFTIFSLTSIILLIRPAVVAPSNPVGLIIGGVILGTLTLMGYLFNNFGVRLMGAARASIIASSGPVLTALLAFLIIQDEKTKLAPIQIFGIVIVTAGVTTLALERMFLQRRLAQQKAREMKNTSQQAT